MSLKQKLQEDLKSSMKNKDNTKKSVVTLIRASIKQFEVDNRVELDDSQVIDIIAKLLKQTKDSLNEFKKAGREDLATQAEAEIEVLKELKLVSPKANDIKTLYYKGAYTENAVECDVVGIVDNNEIILDINGELHSIHPDYLLDMQKKERFIIVDIETPRSFKPADGIREVAAIVVEDYRVIDSLHLAIINDEEQYKNGYGDGLDAIEENEELKSKFKALVKKYKCPLVAHNASL